MQNADTLIELGFRPTPNQKKFMGEYFYRGRNVTFTAKVRNDGPAYVDLYIVGEIDNRPLSDNRGYRLRRPVKQCISDGSVSRAIKKFDVPTDRLNFFIGGCTILD